jgi:transcriptional regulator with GAF, ATPase, and Fis domain
MERADQGTLFLEEVGDIPVEIQAKLLRALQEREFERLGSTHTRRVNNRLNRTTFLSRMKKFGIYAKQYA